MDRLSNPLIGSEDPPIAKLVGFKLISLEPGRSVVEFAATKQHTNSFGILQGGVLCTIADAAMASAYAAGLSAEETFVTIELKVNFLRPVRNAKLQAIGKVIERTGNVGLVQCHILDSNHRLVAYATSTFMKLGQSMKRKNPLSMQLKKETVR